MAYEMYMGNVLCPVTPEKIQLKIKNQNKTMNLITGEMINLLKSAGLTEVSYDLLLPNVKYPFAVYKSGFVDAKYFLDEFERMKIEKKPFQYKVIRTLPGGKTLFDTDMTVSMEDYTIKEDVKEGFDVVVSIKLKQFRHYGTKVFKVSNVEEASGEVAAEVTASVEETRETTNSPAPENSNKTHTVAKGDTLWNIAKKYYGDGSKYTVIFKANKDKIQNANKIYPGQVITIPAL